MSNFDWTLSVYIEDTDLFGVVYHSHYLKFCERARTEWLAAAGLNFSELIHFYGIGFIVHKTVFTFHKPARFKDLLLIKTQINPIRRCLIEFSHQIYCQKKLLVEGTVNVVCAELKNFKPIAVPKAVAHALMEYKN